MNKIQSFYLIRVWATKCLLLLLTTSAVAHERSLAPMLKEVTPAVVNISVSANRGTQGNPFFDDPFFRRFYNIPDQAPQVPRRTQSVGSGVIIDGKDRYVVTNHHVVDGSDEVTVTLQDRRQLKAEIVGSDAATDIALLRIDGPGLSEVALGDSEKLEVGDFVTAIGNPFGLGQTVTSGIVSALGRSGLIPEGYEDFIQTDASINPGNSGGALVESDGKLIGINTAIIAPAGGNVGIGFAVPVNMMKSVVEQLLEYGEVSRGQLGILVQDVTPDLAEALELDTARGALVAQVVEGSAAANAWIQVGDVVLKLNGRTVDDGTDLRNRIGLMRVSEGVEIDLIRDRRRLTVETTIGKASQIQISGRETSPKLDGAELRNIAPSYPDHRRVRGVEVVRVEPGSRAWRAGLRKGDIILSVDRRPVSSVNEFSELLKALDGATALHVQRGDSRLFIVVQ